MVGRTGMKRFAFADNFKSKLASLEIVAFRSGLDWYLGPLNT